ncbi:MAG: 4Fe-4S dicluster domain-containing protein [Bacteroidota bacterium]
MRVVAQEKFCSGCKACNYVCALHHFNENNPKKTAIKVKGHFPRPGGYTVEVCTQGQGCGENFCVRVCPSKAIAIENKVVKIDPAKCTNCGECVERCPHGAMTTHREVAYPIKCDLCGECVTICPTNTLSLA